MLPHATPLHSTLYCLYPATISGVPAIEVLKKGLDDLHDLCGHVLNTFQVSKTLI